MIYKISRYNVCNDRFSYILIYSDYGDAEVCSLVSAYQFYAEELLGSQDIKLSLECLEKILCEHYHITSEYSNYQKYIPFSEKDGCFEGSGFYIDAEDVFVRFIDFNQAVSSCRDTEHSKLIEHWLPKNPEAVEEIKQLILREGLEQ